MIRLIALIPLFLISLLCLFGAPSYHLWLLAVLVTEYPQVFISITLLAAFAGFFKQKYRLAGTLLALITLTILLTPVASAWYISKTVKAELSAALSPKADLFAEKPFDLFKAFRLYKDTLAYSTYTYSDKPDIALTLDYYPAQLPGKRPCMVVIHGGSWSSGNSHQLPELNTFLARKGYNVATINYHLSPEYKSPAPIIDVDNAMRYLKSQAEKLHIDTSNFVLLGRSAGAQIALLAAYASHQTNIKGVIDFYGPADMVWGYSVPSSPLVMDSKLVMRKYLGGAYNDVPQNYSASSPVLFVNKNSPPTLIIHGKNDVLVAYEHSRRLNQKLQQNGVKHYWLKLPWATHGFDHNLNGPGGQLSTYAIEAFLKAVTY